jgi:acyl transferase domain-containing protein/acyl carrier protein
MFGSIAGSCGSPGQSNYAAANSFLWQLALTRRAQGLVALAIDWGPWGDKGMAASLERRHRASGITALKAEQGFKALGAALESDVSHIIVADIDWKIFSRGLQDVPLFSKLVQQEEGYSGLMLQLEEAIASEREEMLISHVKGVAKAVLGIDESKDLSETEGFFELGMDSLMAVQFKNILQNAVGSKYSLSNTVVFDYPNISLLVNYLKQELKLEQLEVKQVSLRKIQAHEAIAIVGMSCRLPGSNSPEELWQVLSTGKDVSSVVPQERWNADNYYDPDPSKENKTYTKWGHFIDNIKDFDASFFGISPREAESMDPQQRILLEICAEALEGYGGLTEAGKERTGVFIGVDKCEFSMLLRKSSGDMFGLTGSAIDVIPSRVAYSLGLQGPTMAIDTACSSSLVAIDAACQNLRLGKCDTVLAGGVNFLLAPEYFVGLCKGKMLSPDGLCKTFDASADGYGRGEGVAVVVLKRLSDAIEHRDKILAVIKGSAVNQDGASSGLTVPNGVAQERVIAEALRDANLKPEDIGYIEAHGTGTSLGDPIEVKAIMQTFKGRSNPLYIGSIKANIGHLEAAAGVSALVKAVMMLQKQQIPPHMHFKKLNPLIDLSAASAEISLELKPWESVTLRRIGISSFGFSGVNSHLIVEEAPMMIEQAEASIAERGYSILSLSAKGGDALKCQIENYLQFIEEHPEYSIEDIAGSAATSRTHFKDRVAVLGRTSVEILANLKNGVFVSGGEAGAKTTAPKLTFIFNASDAQHQESHEEFYRANKIYQIAYDEAIALFAPELRTESRASRFAAEYALYKLWSSYGVKPDYLMGHGIGEYVAAVIAGIITLEDGMRLAASAVEEFASIAKAIEYKAPEIVMISSITGEKLAKDAINAGYFIGQAESETVSMEVAVILDKLGSMSLSTLRFSWYSFLTNLGQLYINGYDIDWAQAEAPYKANRKRVDLPHYPFQRQRYWVKELQGSRGLERSGGNIIHPLLGSKIIIPFSKELHFETIINHHWPEFIKDHIIYGVDVIAGAGYLSSIIEAMKDATKAKNIKLEPIEFIRPVVFDSNSEVKLHTVLKPLSDNSWSFEVMSYNLISCEWVIHVQGKVYNIKAVAVTIGEDREVVKNRCLTHHYNKPQIYDSLSKLGLALGEHFQWIEELWVGEGELLAKLRKPQEEEQEYELYPGLIDSCFQAAIGFNIDVALLAIPLNIASYEVKLGRQKPEWVHIQAKIDQFGIKIDLSLYNKQERVGFIKDFVVREVPKSVMMKLMGQDESQDRLYYQLAFEESKYVEISAEMPVEPGTYLIVSNINEIANKLAAELTTRAQHVTMVSTQDKIELLGYRAIYYIINNEKTLLETQDELAKLVIFIQSLLKQEQKPQLYLITQGLYDIEGVEYQGTIGEGSLIGLHRTLNLECPDLSFTHIDIEQLQDLEHVIKETVLGEVSADQIVTIEKEIAYRGGRRYVARVVAAPMSKEDGQEEVTEVTLSPEGSYLITGGLGGLGLRLANYLKERGAKNLILVGRSKANARAVESIAELKAQGIEVEVYEVDISNKKETNSLIKRIKQKHKPLNGIFHLAGMLDDGIFVTQTAERFAKVFAAKGEGAWNLHEATKSMDLECFVMFGSIAGTFGSPGQSNYAAANSFLNQLAKIRRRQGLSALSVDWGPWAEVGMAAKLEERHRASGVIALKSEQGFKALGEAMAGKITNLVVADVNWQMFAQAALVTNIFANLIVAEVEIADSSLIIELQDAVLSEREGILKDYIRNLVQQVLHLRDSEQLSEAQGFFEMGMDSLMAVELKNKLQRAVGSKYPLSNTIVFDAPNIEALVNKIALILCVDVNKVQLTKPLHEEEASDIIEKAFLKIDSRDTK